MAPGASADMVEAARAARGGVNGANGVDNGVNGVNSIHHRKNGITAPTASGVDDGWSKADVPFDVEIPSNEAMKQRGS